LCESEKNRKKARKSAQFRAIFVQKNDDFHRLQLKVAPHSPARRGSAPAAKQAGAPSAHSRSARY
jgi:hypothetical protein